MDNEVTPKEAAIQKFEDDLITSADENNKIRLLALNSTSFFLPHISNFYEAVGLPSNPKAWIDYAEKLYDIKNPVSRQSLYALYRSGVGKGVIKKLASWMQLLPIPFELFSNKKLFVKTLRSAQAKSNAADWLHAVHGFKLSLSHHGCIEDNEYLSAFDFLESRCKAEVEFNQLVLKKLSDGNLHREDKPEMWKLVKDFWDKNSEIPTDVPQYLEDFNGRQEKNVTLLSEPERQSFLTVYARLILDFYLELITRYEIGCRFYFGIQISSREDIEKNDRLGIVTRAVQAFVNDEDAKTCFGGMLNELRLVISEPDTRLSKRELAAYIDIEDKSEGFSGETLNDKQYHEFKAWRSGKYFPSLKKLECFLLNIDEGTGENRISITLPLCCLAIGLDRLATEIKEHAAKDGFSEHEIVTAIKEVLSTMPDYYRRNTASYIATY